MHIPVHSPWLPGYIDVVQTILIVLTMPGLFPTDLIKRNNTIFIFNLGTASFICLLLHGKNRTNHTILEVCQNVLNFSRVEILMVARYMGVDSTSPCTRLKHLANVLRNREYAQQYPSMYEDRRPKLVEDIEKSDGKESASGQ